MKNFETNMKNEYIEECKNILRMLVDNQLIDCGIMKQTFLNQYIMDAQSLDQLRTVRDMIFKEMELINGSLKLQ